MSNVSNQNINETDLISGSIARDHRMQEALYNRFAPKMYAVCLRYANNPADAEDLLQEGFIKIFKNLEKFRAEGSFEGWMRRVFINTSIEHYRKKINLLSTSDKEDISIADTSSNALDKLAERDIIMLIQQLSPGYRTVFNLYVVEGFSHKEISGMLKISEGTSKSQLARAKGILQKKVVEFLGENSTHITR